MPVFHLGIDDVSIDETPDLQNLTSTPAPAGDADDNDIGPGNAAAGLTRLQGLVSAPAIGAAANRVLHIDTASSSAPSIGEAKGVDIQIAAIDTARAVNGTDGTTIVSALLAVGQDGADTIVSVRVVEGAGGLETLYELGDGQEKVTWRATEAGIVHDSSAPSASTRDQVFATTADGFTRLTITHADRRKQDAVAPGGLAIGGDAGDPLALQFGVDGVDGDGDVGLRLIGVTLNP